MPQHCDRIPELGGAFCVLPPGNCICKSETHLPDTTLSKCLEYRLSIGETCERDTQCSKIGDGAICDMVNGCTCDVDNNYFSHPDGTRCLTYAENLGEHCEPRTDVCKNISGAYAILMSNFILLIQS